MPKPGGNRPTPEEHALEIFCAEHVLKLTRTERPDDRTKEKVRQFWVDDGRVLISRPWKRQQVPAEFGELIWEHSWELFNPTQDEADAMRVQVACVKHLAKTSDHYNCFCVCWLEAEQRFAVTHELTVVTAEADDLPLAICRAAYQIIFTRSQTADSAPSP